MYTNVYKLTSQCAYGFGFIVALFCLTSFTHK